MGRERILQAIARLKEMTIRAARMIVAHESNRPLPQDALFSEPEMKELDEFLSDVWAEETGTTPQEGGYTPPVRQAYSTDYYKRDDRIAWLRAFKVSLEQSKKRFENLLILGSGEVHIGDKFDVSNWGQMGAVGPNSVVSDNVFEQGWQKLACDIDLSALADELSALRIELRRSASSVEDDAAVAAVAFAEKAARAEEGPVVLKHLKAAGRWALESATKIGTAVAAKAIEKSIWP